MKDKALSLKERIYVIIFEADTPAGKTFDVFLLLFILGSVAFVMLETVEPYGSKYAVFFEIAEWVFTVVFSLEYLLRIYSAKNRLRYILSFYGMIDLLAILPSLIGLLIPKANYMITIRAFRLLRVFRILKLGNYLVESQILITALKASRHKITVFLGTVIILIVIIGSAMYVVENPVNEKYSSIPQSMYWAVVTVTTVGFGDIVPITPLGQFLSSILMIIGYGILAVPTGIVSVELAQATQNSQTTIHPSDCPVCTPEDHDIDAVYCKFCGAKV